MNHQLAIDTTDHEDLISRNLVHCSCCHQDLDRVEAFSVYSDAELDSIRLDDDRSVWCDTCNPCLCHCELAFEVYEPRHGDKIVPCPECKGDTVVFGSDWS